jgi:acetylornithine/N-succinyldiaminopimelate aminotransferase
MKVTFDDIQAQESRHVLQTYKRQPVAFVRGSGSRLYDVDGREYLDFVSGIGVTSLGHAHPGLAAAIAEQAKTLLHTSNLYYHPFQAQAASRLVALSGLARAFFCNSGTEANEACLKFARRYWYTRGARERVGFVAIEGGFAGRTMGALSVTHDAHYREPFMPLLEPVTFVDPDDPAALARAVTDRTAAIIAEPQSSPSRSAARTASVRCRRSSPRPSRTSAAGPVRCSLPTRFSADSAGPGTRSTHTRSAGSRT